ncbi:hypothetical protein DY000_02009346 [Brassica cretica]|uniref:RNase H type-1 domain-containing protein n=1 Tax=Brassica cretica TaxID=69181 RepID=A0ABQ7CBJ9_BRACR|nr:hypothetical protein DY000_02009346 [Brassica cretica]
MSSSNYFRSWIDRPHLDPNTRLLTEEYQRGITEFMGLVHRQPEAKTDAAWAETTRTAGLGWAIKTARGTQRFSSSTTFVTSPLMAESLAMREAIKKSKELGIRRLRCESDSSQLIKALSHLLNLWRFMA